jgi:hypothetical protein
LNGPLLSALNGARTISRDHDSLVLRDASGQTQIVLTSLQVPPP